MRHKDDNKSDAIFHATIELLNEIGFSEISMSKIARRANVSQATIYVYFESKEDLLGKIYMKVKQKMSLQLFQHIDETLPTRDALEMIMRNMLRFMLDNEAYFMFLEQFAASPLLGKLCLDDTSSMFIPLFEQMEKGKRLGEIKPIETTFLLTYCYFPIAQLAKAHYKGQYEASEDNLQSMIRLSWDAIKA